MLEMSNERIILEINWSGYFSITYWINGNINLIASNGNMKKYMMESRNILILVNLFMLFTSRQKII
ncbi:hypothetical protein DAT1711_14750 [Enterococcus cecorum]